MWLLLPAALLLFRRNLVWLLLIAVLPPGFETAAAADYETFWQHRDTRAFAAYRQRDFAVAASLARSPMLKGTALYRQDDFTGAMEMFGQDDTAAAHYNRGNSLVQLERYDEAIGAYARALELDPGLAAARFNRRLVTLFLQQGEATEDTAADNGDIAGEDFETAEQGADLRRIGTIGQEFSNPADQQQLESGLGASRQSGQAAPFERFDGSEEALERFVLREGSDPDAAALVFERWVETLPATSSDLFKRKFLRDYERQKRQVR